MADEHQPIDGDLKRKERDDAPQGEEGDIPLTCRDCSTGFLHTVADQVRARGRARRGGQLG